eukprot:185151-Rhodomonas_salina.1
MQVSRACVCTQAEQSRAEQSSGSACCLLREEDGCRGRMLRMVMMMMVMIMLTTKMTAAAAAAAAAAARGGASERALTSTAPGADERERTCAGVRVCTTSREIRRHCPLPYFARPAKGPHARHMSEHMLFGSGRENAKASIRTTQADGAAAPFWWQRLARRARREQTCQEAHVLLLRPWEAVRSCRRPRCQKSGGVST